MAVGTKGSVTRKHQQQRQEVDRGRKWTKTGSGQRQVDREGLKKKRQRKKKETSSVQFEFNNG